MITLSSVIIPIASMNESKTKILMDRSKTDIPMKVPIKETGNATAGTITLLILPKKRKIIKVTSTKAIISVFHISKIAAFTYVLRSNEIFKLNPSGRFFSIFFILFFILLLNSRMLAESLAYRPMPTILSSGFVFLLSSGQLVLF